MTTGKEAKFRKPFEDEMRLLQLAVEQTDQPDIYRRQLRNARVRYDCECGCPSLEVRVAGGAPRTAVARKVGTLGVAVYSEGDPCWVDLFIEDGAVRTLELAPMGEKPPRGAALTEIREARTKRVMYMSKERDA